jgi:hypothetical protein
VRAAAGVYIPAAGLKEDAGPVPVQDEDGPGPHLGDPAACKALESAGIKLGSVASEITGKGPVAMIEALISGGTPRRGDGGPGQGPGADRGKLADLSMALEGRFTDHHALMCRLHLDRIRRATTAVAGLEQRIAGTAAAGSGRSACSRPSPGSATWSPGLDRRDRPGPAPVVRSPREAASWVSLAPGNNISAGKRKHGRTGDAGTYIKPMLIQAAWAATQVRGRLQARYNRLVRRLGGPKNPGREEEGHRGDRAHPAPCCLPYPPHVTIRCERCSDQRGGCMTSGEHRAVGSGGLFPRSRSNPACGPSRRRPRKGGSC